MNRILTAFKNLWARLVRRKHLLAVVIVAIFLLPTGARAAGLSDILSLLQTITSTIQNTIGGVLSGIQNVESTIENFRQRVIWPLNEINQIKGFVRGIEGQYRGLMSQILTIKNNSATLANPAQLESVFRSSQAATIGQLQAAYTQLYSTVPQPSDAKPVERNMIDMDDALAVGSLKTAVISDQTTQGMLGLADSLEQQTASAAPGSAPLLSAQAQVSNLEAQAQLAKMLAAELRQEAAKLAHQNTLLKESAAATRNLQNQVQQVLTRP